jgi:hypothetical protein
MSRVFTQKVSATMHRVKCDKLGYVFARRNTEVCMGPNNRIQGAFIMSNPGSYSPKYSDRNWNSYCLGEGDDKLQGWGYPDPTMQNVIQVLSDASKEADFLLDGIIEIYNLSAVVQPQGQNAEQYHNLAEKALMKDERQHLLHEVWMKDQFSFEEYILERNYQFVIVGFADKLFEGKRMNVQAWSGSHPNIFYATDNSGRWSHPRRWRTEPELGKQIRDNLVNHFKNLLKQGEPK